MYFIIILTFFVAWSSSYAETLPAGTQFRDTSLEGEPYTSGSILRRLSEIDQRCKSRVLDDSDVDYRFLGSLNGKGPFTPEIIQQLAAMSDILDAKQAATQDMKAARSYTWASLAANVLRSSAVDELALIQNEAARFAGRPQHAILNGTAIEIEKVLENRKKTQLRKARESKPPAMLLPEHANDRSTESNNLATQPETNNKSAPLWRGVFYGLLSALVVLICVSRFMQK